MCLFNYPFIACIVFFISFSCLFIFLLNSLRYLYTCCLISLTVLSSLFWVHCLRFHALHYCSSPLLWNCWLLEKTCCLVFSYDVLRFTHLRPSFWLKVLIAYVLLVEVSTMFRKEWVVAGLWYIFSPLDSGHGSVIRYSSIKLQTLGTSSYSIQEDKD
jgi:hypothetical protein